MSSLRARFTLLLIVAVFSVMMLASFVTAQLLGRPSEGRLNEILVEKAEIAAVLFKQDPGPRDGSASKSVRDRPRRMWTGRDRRR